MNIKYKSFYILLILILLAGLGQIPEVSAQEGEPTSLNEIFTGAATEFDVPVDLLLAIAWTRSHIRNQVSTNGDYGLMQLPTEQPNQIAQAARLLGQSEATVKTDNKHNVRGAAALLHQLAREQYPNRTILTAAEWYQILLTFSMYGNKMIAEQYSQQVFKILATGLQVQVDDENFVINRWPDAQELITTADVSVLSDDYPPARWVAAHTSNYSDYSRGADNIDMIVIHTMQGYYQSSINMFTNANKGASAHYFIRSNDGEVTQMVRDEDVAWHAGHWDTNLRSIGIEHEGFINDSSWYTEAMYQSSAKLVRYLADKYGIPLDRNHIIGHVEVPGCPYSGGGVSCHTDPGSNWNWTYFMGLITDSPPPSSTSVEVYPTLNPSAPASGCGNSWYAFNDGTYNAWLTLNAATGSQSTNSGVWQPDLPADGIYKVEAYVASRSQIQACGLTYNYDTSNAIYTVNHTGGSTTVIANQMPVLGWMNLGNFQFNANSSSSVHLTDFTGETFLSRVVSFSKMRFTCVSGCNTEPPPQAAFTASPTSGTAPLAVSFTNSSSNYTSSLWNFGDGQTSTATSPAHSYASAGNYTVSLKVTGPGGSNTFTRTNYIAVTAPPTPPQAAFTGSPTSGTAPLAVSFTNSSSNYTSSLWNFGDGQTSTATSPAHSYASAGSYTVSLKVTGPGGSNTFTRTNYIVASAPPTTGPALSIPANIPAAVGQPVQVPIRFTPNGATIASTIFSIDYDQTCLTFNPADSNSDGVPDAVSLNLPATFSRLITFDSADTAGELDFSIFSLSLAALPDDVLATITFTPKTACQPATGTTRTIAVDFAIQPAVSFGNPGGGSVAGSAVNGSVQLGGALPGDANSDNKVDAGDLTALVLEIFDGDGDSPGNVGGGSFPGSAGADANRDGVVNAGDITCTVLLIFGGACGGSAALEVQPLAAPSLTLPGQIVAIPGEAVTVPVQFAANGNSISSLVFSLDIDPAWLSFDPSDTNADGLPDGVQVSLPANFNVSATYDPADTDGELDISVYSLPVTALPDGQLMSLTFTAGAPDVATETTLAFSTNPSPSFGSSEGQSLVGTASGGTVTIGSSGFSVFLPVVLK